MMLARRASGTAFAARAAPAFRKALDVAGKQTGKMIQRVPMLVKADPKRLTVALAESLVFRGAVKPITFGGKLYLSYAFVMRGKTTKKVTTATLSMGARGRDRALGMSTTRRR